MWDKEDRKWIERGTVEMRILNASEKDEVNEYEK